MDFSPVKKLVTRPRFVTAIFVEIFPADSGQFSTESFVPIDDTEVFKTARLRCSMSGVDSNEQAILNEDARANDLSDDAKAM